MNDTPLYLEVLISYLSNAVSMFYLINSVFVPACYQRAWYVKLRFRPPDPFIGRVLAVCCCTASSKIYTSHATRYRDANLPSGINHRRTTSQIWCPIPLCQSQQVSPYLKQSRRSFHTYASATCTAGVGVREHDSVWAIHNYFLFPLHVT